MTPPPEAEAWPDIDPSLYQSPFPAPGPRFTPTVHETSPLGTVGSPSQIPSPEGVGVGGGASLVPYISITSTVPQFPSDIARKALDNIYCCETVRPVCSDFVDYLDQCEQKGFMIKGYDTVKGEILNLPLSYDNRWSPNRRRELSEKLKRLEFWFEEQENRPVTMITFTSYREGLSVSSAWHELNKSRGKLLKLIAKYFPEAEWVIDEDGYLELKIRGPDYFWVPEPHPETDDGYVHYHIAVFAKVDNYTRDNSKHVGWVKCKGRENENIWELMDGRGIEDKFRDLWSKKYKTGNHTYGLDFSQKKGDGKIQHLKDYLLKYLAKGFLLDKWTRGMLIFNANLWETGFRMYGASKRIREMMNIKSDKPSQIVWLETKMMSPEEVSEDIVDTSAFPPTKKTVVKIIESERIIWYRQYIPDWIDSDFWLTPEGHIMPEDPPPQYIYDWGRPCSHHAQEYKVTSWQDMNLPKRKKEIDPYEQFNKDYAASCAPSGLKQGSAPRDKYGLL